MSGNVTKNAQERVFTYDAENLQTTVAGTNLSTTYGYDGNNKRVKSFDAVNNQTMIFVYDANGNIAAEYTINVPAPTSPTISYLTEDALGSVRVTTNSFGEVKARRDFFPFGEEIWSGYGARATNQKYSSNSDDTRKKFATYQRDGETGLDFAQSRYFSPMHGRFTSPDEFKGGPDELFDFEEDASDNPTFYAELSNPQSLNKYQYAYNNPYKNNDPDGHCPLCVLLFEAASTAVDVIETVRTFRDPNASRTEKIVTAGGTLLGIIAPGGGYGAAGKYAVKAFRREATEQVAKRADDVVDAVKPTVRGLNSEQRVLKSEKLIKNTKKVSSKEGNSVPDAITKKKIVEIKDAKRVSNTRQIRIQRDAAKVTGRWHEIITGKNTKVSNTIEKRGSKVERRDDIGPQ